MSINDVKCNRCLNLAEVFFFFLSCRFEMTADFCRFKMRKYAMLFFFFWCICVYAILKNSCRIGEEAAIGKLAM